MRERELGTAPRAETTGAAGRYTPGRVRRTVQEDRHRRRGWLACLAGCLVSCLPEGAPPWLVDHPIVASLRFDVVVPGPYSPESPRDDRSLASLMPGDRLRATPFLVGPTGPIDPADVRPAWFYCRTTRCYGDLTAEALPRPCDVEEVGSTTTCALGRAAAPELKLGELRSLVDLFIDPPALLMIAGTPGGTSTPDCVERLRVLDERGETLQRCILLMEPLPLGPLWRLMVLAGFAGLPDALPLDTITPQVQSAEPALYPAVLPFELTITGTDGATRERVAVDQASVQVARGEQVEIYAPVDIFDAQIYYQALVGSVGNDVVFQAGYETFTSSWLFTADVAPNYAGPDGAGDTDAPPTGASAVQQVWFSIPEDAPPTFHGYYLLGDGRSQVWAWLRFEVRE